MKGYTNKGAVLLALGLDLSLSTLKAGFPYQEMNNAVGVEAT